MVVIDSSDEESSITELDSGAVAIAINSSQLALSLGTLNSYSYRSRGVIPNITPVHSVLCKQGFLNKGVAHHDL